VSSAIVGRAGNRTTAIIAPTLASTVAPAWAVISIAQREIGTAATIDPYTTTVVSPRLSLDAGRAASLVRHLHATGCIGIAVVASAIVGRAGKCTAAIIAPTLASAVAPTSASASEQKIRATTTIDPDTTAIGSPRLSLNAGRAATLVRHLHTPACIYIAMMPTTIIGGACYLPAILICNSALRPTLRRTEQYARKRQHRYQPYPFCHRYHLRKERSTLPHN